MKKKLKARVSLLAAAAVLALLPGSNTLTAKAEEAKTYSVKFIGDNVNDWRYVPGSTFDDYAIAREIYYLNQELKAGDAVVVYAGDATPNKELQLADVKLGNLTIHRDATAAVITGGVTDCYVLAGAVAAINGDVRNANLYDTTTCTFNNNVLDMVLNISDVPHSNISCVGTVGHFRTASSTGGGTNEFYDIAQGAMSMVNGTFQITKYSPTPSEAYLAAMNGTTDTTTSTATPAPASTPSSTPSSSEYDEVPKTGEHSMVIWFVCAAAVLFAGSYVLYRKSEQ